MVLKYQGKITCAIQNLTFFVVKSRKRDEIIKPQLILAHNNMLDAVD